MIPGFLSVLALISAVLNIATEYFGPEWLRYLSKGLAIFLILLVAVTAGKPGSKRYQWLVVAALGLSLIGDMLLVLPFDFFLFGLLAFLAAHLLYIGAFRADPGGEGLVLWALVPFVISLGLVYLFLIPGLESMAIPVAFYVVVIGAMGWLAVQRWSKIRDRAALYAAVGAVLFAISDSILAVNRFRVEFNAAPLLVLTSYYLAQWLLARSVDQNRLDARSGPSMTESEGAGIT
jgi:uncharacterized membrane protein YhhN